VTSPSKPPTSPFRRPYKKQVQITKKEPPSPPADRPRQRINAPVAGGVVFASWSGSAGAGQAGEVLVAADGRIVGSTPVNFLQRFIIRATQADGARYSREPRTRQGAGDRLGGTTALQPRSRLGRPDSWPAWGLCG